MPQFVATGFLTGFAGFIGNAASIVVSRWSLVVGGAAGRLKSLHQLLKDFPSVNDAIVFSSAPFGEIPEQRLRFLPIYFAGSLRNMTEA